MTKYCSGCKSHKDLDSFQNSKAFKDGKTTRCSDCLNRYRREGGHNTVKKRGPVKHNPANQLRYSHTVKGRAQSLYQSAARRAKKNNRDFELDIDWIKQKLEPMICEVTGLPLSFDRGDCYMGMFAPSLDRKDNSLGYTKDNTMIVCFIYNRAKADGTHEDVLTLANALTKNGGGVSVLQP